METSGIPTPTKGVIPGRGYESHSELASASSAATGPYGSAHAPAELDDPRLVDAMQQYLTAAETGRRPERAEFLSRFPEIAAELAACLESLEFVQQVGPRLDGPSPGSGRDLRAANLADLGVPLGDFRILRELGRGGMGIVYEAEQLSLARRIALKVLPFALTLDTRQLQRFKNEARAAAQLHHTNIVPIYSVGCERGVHFYAMQFVEGQSLAMVVRELRQLSNKAGLEANPLSGSTHSPSGPRKESQATGPYPLEPVDGPSSAARATHAGGATDRSTRTLAFFRSTARLGLQAAEALEHAHSLGVVHRDIKPGNLLVDVNSHLWVTDFGLAQFQSDAALTVTGDVVGTLRYMSPEQALAKRKLVDHRTDIYSLGATLYELLTLEPPFRGRDREELLRQIAFEEPKPLRRLNASVPLDLETIVLKALAKAPDERYATAQELADDLRRFLDDQPILARRPTALEKFAKWSRRHRPVVTSVVVLLVLAAVGLVTSTVLIAQEQARTKAAYQAEARQRLQAEESFRQARQAVDAFTEITEAELAERPELQEVRRRFLEAALKYYQEFITSRGDDPAVRAELVESVSRVGSILSELDRRPEAVAAMIRGLNILDRLPAHPTPEDQRALASIYFNLDWLHGGARLSLLSLKAVQEDLKFEAHQVERIKEMADRRLAGFRGPVEINRIEWGKRVAELTAQEQSLAELLRPEQTVRLQQLLLQQQGVRAFADPQVAQALELTAEQKATIRTILSEAGLSRPESRGAPPHYHGPPPRKGEDYWKSVREKVLKVLTAEQRTRWDAKFGLPFKGELRVYGPGGPGGPGGQGGFSGPPRKPEPKRDRY